MSFPTLTSSRSRNSRRLVISFSDLSPFPSSTLLILVFENHSHLKQPFTAKNHSHPNLKPTCSIFSFNQIVVHSQKINQNKPIILITALPNCQNHHSPKTPPLSRQLKQAVMLAVSDCSWHTLFQRSDQYLANPRLDEILT